MISYFESILSSLEEGKHIDAVYLDFAYAFDEVHHNIIFFKLQWLNVQGNIICWISSFLKDREQIVKIGYVYFKPTSVTSAVPQGSVLGPLLFIFLVLDIDHSIVISSIASKTIMQQHQFQQDLISVYEWANDNDITLNRDNFFHVSYTPNCNPPTVLKPSKEPIPTVSCTTDLDLLVQDNLQLKQNMANIAAKANFILAWALRSIYSREIFTMKTLLKQVIIVLRNTHPAYMLSRRPISN